MKARPTVFYVVGPTASGKSALALELARRWEGEIVNADAFQVYQGLAVLSGAPTPEEMSLAPHHLYLCRPVSEERSAAKHAVDVQAAIAEVVGRGRTAIVVGGGGLYVKAVTHGLADLPSDPALRAELEAKPLDALVAELRAVDPEAAGRVNLKNPRYVCRALEIALLTGGGSPRAWRSPPEDTVGVFLNPQRDWLYRRIDARVDWMIAHGALDEVAAIGEGVSNTAAKAIGLRELRRHLQGEIDPAQAIRLMQQATRRYAKRQITWFKRERCFLPLLATGQETASHLADQCLPADDLGHPGRNKG